MSQENANAFDPERLVYKTDHTRTWNQAWIQIHEMFGDAIIAYARHRGLDESSAQDVLQEVMTSVIRSHHGMEKAYNQSNGAFQAWLWGVIRNRVFEAYRRNAKTPLLKPIENAEGDECREEGREGIEMPLDYAELEEQAWQQAVLDAAMIRVKDRVGPEKFAIFVSLMKEEASPDELAERTGNTRNNIDAIKFRCKNMAIEEAKKIGEEWNTLQGKLSL